MFKGKDEEVKYDIEKATRYLLVAGMINYKTVTKEDYEKHLEDAYDIMENWREENGFIGILHIIIINLMEKKHFFMGTQDIRILEHLASNNLWIWSL